MTSLVLKSLREMSASLTLGVFLGAAATSGAVCGVAAFWVAWNDRLLAQVTRQVKSIAVSARDAALSSGVVLGGDRRTKVRHIVMFAFKPQAPVDDIVGAFDKLVVELGDLVIEYERGTQCSPEGLDKGTTHAFVLTFPSVKARDTYLPHPLHEAFVAKWAKPWVQEVVVTDYEAVQRS